MFQIDRFCLTIVAALGLFNPPSVIVATPCNLFSSSPYNGRYCPADGVDTLGLLPHQCRYICLQSASCKAYNYNNTEEVCTRFTQPCSVAAPDTEMEYAVFNEKSLDQCYQWVSYRSDPRMLPTDHATRLICRMKKSGNDLLYYYYSNSALCYGAWGDSEFTSVMSVYNDSA